MKKYSFFILLFAVLVSLFFCDIGMSMATVHGSIKIITQPFSTGSVDLTFSQKPVVSVKDLNNSPIQGVTVTAVASGAGELSGDLAEVTDSNGLATFDNLSYSGVDPFKIIFGSSVGKATSESMQLLPGVASASKSLIYVSPLTVVADGESLATIKIQCEDQYGNIIPGADVKVSTSGSNNVLSQPGVKDQPGVTTVNLSSTTAESKTISVAINGIGMGNSSPVNFVAGRIAKLSISTDSPVDTDHKSEIIITGKDKFDNIVTNDSTTQLALSADNGALLDTSLATFNQGVIMVHLSRANSGIVNVFASKGDVSGSTKVVFNSADTTSPVISAQYPLGGAEDVPLDVISYINFSKKIDTATITDYNVQLRKSSDNSLVKTTISVANGGKQIRFQPDTILSPGAKYYLYVGIGVVDLSGNALELPYSGNSFTTASTVANKISNNISSGSIDVSAIKNSDEAENIVISSNNTIVAKAGNKESKENLFSYATAGILNVLKVFSIDKFGNWLVSNFVWAFLFLIVASLVYIYIYIGIFTFDVYLTRQTLAIFLSFENPENTITARVNIIVIGTAIFV